MSEYEYDFVEEDEGTYGKGFAGAFLGAAAGAVVWAIAMGIGYLSGLLGLVIGFAAGKGYDYLKGKQGKCKILIQLLASVIGVLVGSVVGLCLSAVVNMNETGVAMEHFAEYMQMILSDSNVAVMIALDVAQGLFCAAGAVVVLRLLDNKR